MGPHLSKVGWGGGDPSPFFLWLEYIRILYFGLTYLFVPTVPFHCLRISLRPMVGARTVGQWWTRRSWQSSAVPRMFVNMDSSFLTEQLKEGAEKVAHCLNAWLLMNPFPNYPIEHRLEHCRFCNRSFVRYGPCVLNRLDINTINWYTTPPPPVINHVKYIHDGERERVEQLPDDEDEEGVGARRAKAAFNCWTSCSNIPLKRTK